MRQTTSFLVEDAIRAREDRNGYFQKGYDYLNNNSIRGKINDKNWHFHWNINLYIDMMAKCNGKCKFCINKVNFSRQDVPDAGFINNLKVCFENIRFLDPSIQIVGGEPTLNPGRLFMIIDLIRKFNLRKPVLGTNGSGLCDAGLLDKIEPVFEHVNISRHHFDNDKFNKLMGFTNVLNNQRLKEIIRDHVIGRKIRLNCCLLSGSIESFEKIVEYLNWAMDMGVRNVCFSTLSILPCDYIYHDDAIACSRQNMVDFNGIMRELTKDTRFKFIKFHTGSHCMYEVWNYCLNEKTCTVVFSTSNNNFAKILDDSEDLVEQLVFHTDGVLTGSWNRNCKVIR